MLMKLVNIPARISVLAALGVATLLLLLALVFTPATPLPEPDSATSHRVVATGDDPVRFHDTTLSAGLYFAHLQGDEHLSGLDETLGAGACVLDYDNDGFPDLFLVNGSGQTRFYGSSYWWQLPKGNRLFYNVGGKRFEDVTKKAGLVRTGWGMACATGDLDNDGDADLIVANKGMNRIYRNNGDGTFADITAASGISGSQWSSSIALADFDGDGRLDIYVTNYLQFKKGSRRFEGGSQYQPGLPSDLNPALFPGDANVLYRNTGQLQFQDVTKTAGVADASGRGLAALWLDVNDDHRPDLFVLNDVGFANTLFINQGDGRFSEEGERYRLNDARGTRTARLADMNNDNVYDIAVGSVAGFTNEILTPLSELHGFTDHARLLGVAGENDADSDTWGLAIADYNNDGYPDLLTGNGLTKPDTDVEKISQAQEVRLWLGGANGFAAAPLTGDGASDTLSARGAVTFDFDNDGRMDVYLPQNNGLGQLLHNESHNDNHWIGIHLIDTRGNHDAIGASVSVHAGGREQTQWLGPSGSMSSGDKRLLFGLGKTDNIETLRVRWPDGRKDSYSDLSVDRYLRIARNADPETEGVADPAKKTSMAAHTLPFADRPAAERAALLGWLIKARGKNALPLLESAVSDPDPSVRIQLAKLLAPIRDPHALALATDLLDDKDVEVRLAALDTVSHYEYEHAIRWLLRCFHDPDPRVRAAVARTFEYYFHEEEAVVYRKYLALPDLIDGLKDSDPAVRIASADALGEAERYRAMAPLISTLQDKDEHVRAAAVRALGMIRERDAIPAVVAAYKRRDESPLVLAHCLIALKRLDADQYGQLWKHLRSISGEKARRRDWEILHAIVSDRDDGVVVPHPAVSPLVLHLSRRLVPAKLPTEYAATVVDVVQHGAGTRGRSILRRFTSHRDPKIRIAAWTALVQLAPAGNISDIRAALRDRDPSVRTAVLAAVAGQDIHLSRTTQRTLLHDSATRTAAVSFMAHHARGSDAPMLRKIAWDPKEQTPARVSALAGLARLCHLCKDYDPHDKIAALLNSKHEAVRVAALDFALGSKDARLLRDFYRWLADTNVALPSRRVAVHLLPRYRPAGASAALLKQARLRHDPLSVDAIAVLGELADAGQDRYLWTVFRNHDETDRVRFAAARGLSVRHSAKLVTELLR
jgi:HEAT repeat protein